jgi:O-acetyl-ADP-ribose deacetylase (regulator of RNase III)
MRFFSMVIAKIVEGDLLDQAAEVIVNSWNRNIIPWWLLWPQGVAGAIRRRAGFKPFIELGRCGPIALGQCVQTTAGKLAFRSIIHAAGINMCWRASHHSIAGSVRSAMDLVQRHGYRSVAFPVLGAGVGGFSEEAALQIMCQTLASIDSSAEVLLVKYKA